MMQMPKIAKSVAIRSPRLIGYLILILVSGCGLLMDNEDRLNRAEQALADGDYRAAIIDAKDVLLDEPNNVRGRLLLARASIEVGDGAAAEKELRRAMKLGTVPVDIAAEFARALLIQRKFSEVLSEVPLDGLASSSTESIVRVAYGDAHLGLNQREVAREMYLSALELQDDNLNARLGIASSYIAERNFLQARAAIDHILESNADNARVWLYSGSFNLQVGDFESAEANFVVANDLAIAQGDAAAGLQAQAGLAESLLEQGDVESARPHVEQLTIAAPNALQTMMLIARVAIEDQDWVSAQRNLQLALKAAPNYRPARVLLGAVHLTNGDLAQAEMYLSAAVASAPDDVRARQMLAETRLQMQKADEALEALAPIVSAPDADIMSLQMAARASLGRHEVDDALEYLRRSVAEYPGNADLQLQLAATLLRSGRQDEAQDVLNRIDVSGSEGDAYRRDALTVLGAIREGAPAEALQAAETLTLDYTDHSGAFNLLGAIQLGNNDKDGARTSFEQAEKLNPSDTMARRYLAAIDEASGDPAAAAARYEAILEDSPDTTWALFALGRIAFIHQDYQTAANYFRRALEAEPGNAEHRFSLARAERQLGNRESAESLFDGDIEGSLQHLPSAVMLGSLKAEAGDIAGAMDIASRLKEKHPGNSAVYAFEGEVLLLSGDIEGADAAYDKALSISPVKRHAIRSYRIKRRLGVSGADEPLIEFLEARPLDNQVRVVLAESHMQANNLDESIVAYERVVSEEPDNAVALNNLAWAYYLAKDSRATETAQKARDAMPDNGSIVDTLGWIMVQKGSLKEGESLLREAVEMENGRAEIRYHHAVALAKLGKIEEARATLRHALEDDQNFSSRKDAEKLLAEL